MVSIFLMGGILTSNYCKINLNISMGKETLVWNNTDITNFGLVHLICVTIFSIWAAESVITWQFSVSGHKH